MIAHNAESAPEEISPEPLTDPDVNLSIHLARATKRRLPPSVKARNSFRLPVDFIPTWVTCPPFAPQALPRFLATTRQCATAQRMRFVSRLSSVF